MLDSEYCFPTCVKREWTSGWGCHYWAKGSGFCPKCQANKFVCVCHVAAISFVQNLFLVGASIALFNVGSSAQFNQRSSWTMAPFQRITEWWFLLSSYILVFSGQKVIKFKLLILMERRCLIWIPLLLLCMLLPVLSSAVSSVDTFHPF